MKENGLFLSKLFVPELARAVYRWFSLTFSPTHPADLIASGLSPLKPELAAIAAGRIVLSEIDRLVRGRENFSFESTLSGRSHAARLAQMKTAGYRVEIVLLKTKSPQLALRRISARVRQGGHGIPREDVLRRFARSWANFSAIYRPLADEW